MTREQILAMPAGPELDALVASRVLGLEVGYGEILTVEPDRNGDPNIVDHQPIPKYSEKIWAAWLVVEKMIAEGWECEFAYSMTHKKWECAFNNGGWLCEGPFRDTAPHAIVVTALLAKLNSEGKA